MIDTFLSFHIRSDRSKNKCPYLVCCKKGQISQPIPWSDLCQRNRLWFFPTMFCIRLSWMLVVQILEHRLTRHIPWFLGLTLIQHKTSYTCKQKVSLASKQDWWMMTKCSCKGLPFIISSSCQSYLHYFSLDILLLIMFWIENKTRIDYLSSMAFIGYYLLFFILNQLGSLNRIIFLCNTNYKTVL